MKQLEQLQRKPRKILRLLQHSSPQYWCNALVQLSYEVLLSLVSRSRLSSIPNKASVGRALHWCCGGHGFKSCWSLRFYLLLLINFFFFFFWGGGVLCNCFSCFITMRIISLLFFLCSTYKYDLYHIHIISVMCGIYILEQTYQMNLSACTSYYWALNLQLYVRVKHTSSCLLDEHCHIMVDNVTTYWLWCLVSWVSGGLKIMHHDIDKQIWQWGAYILLKKWSPFRIKNLWFPTSIFMLQANAITLSQCTQIGKCIIHEQENFAKN